MDSITQYLGTFGVLALGLFLLVAAALWFMVPFILLGISNRLDKLIDLQSRANALAAKTPIKAARAVWEVPEN